MKSNEAADEEESAVEAAVESAVEAAVEEGGEGIDGDPPAAQDAALPTEWPDNFKKIVSQLPEEAKPPSNYSGSASYVVDYGGNSPIGVWLNRRCFYVYKAVTQPSSGSTKINKQGGLTVGWKSDIAAAWETATSAVVEDI